jgi:hypothetical protein
MSPLNIKQLKLPLFGLAVFLILSLVIIRLSPIVSGAASDDALDKPFGNVNDIASLTNVIFQLGIGICVLAAAIYIAFGSFYYFLASGDAKLAQKGKEVIQRAIIGLILALVSWIILNTIHPQFTKLEIKELSFLQTR